MKRRKCEPRSKNAIPVAGPSVFFAVDAICRCAEKAGWRGEDAFFAAMVMHAHGITPTEGARLFQEAQHWIQ